MPGSAWARRPRACSSATSARRWSTGSRASSGFQAAAEPVQTCVTNRATDVFTRLSRYQLGGDLLWQRDY